MVDYFILNFFFFFFKQKTAYEMLRSLVGSEMCIRDSSQCGGYGCAVWQLFHTLLQNTPDNQSPLFTLQAIRRFVSYFFGCVECQSHFAHMSRSLELEIDSRDARRVDGVLWLWKAHNRVTRRLASMQGHVPTMFPSQEHCPVCKDHNVWNDPRVYEYLKLVYSDPASHRQVAKLVVTKDGAVVPTKVPLHPVDKHHDKKSLQGDRVCDTAEVDCSKVCGVLETYERKCIAEPFDLGKPGLRLLCMCQHSQGPTSSGQHKDGHQSVEQSNKTKREQEAPSEGVPGTHWEEPASKPGDTADHHKSKGLLQKLKKEVSVSGSEDKRNLTLGVMILAATIVVVVGVLIHYKLSKDSSAYKAYTNCWNASVVPAYSQVKTYDEYDDPFLDKSRPRAHPAQSS
eukprot:TRINITY_DN19352_c0_g1_i3.p1 TRINITY_DN19352_c0_g1~~TRINITY_DN19352_c0_g1_i3.p1  ORF type:complete len:398 (-),score=100.51 TRINITY_DN19352_c0_g1_i3:355-1548(-)